MSSPFDTLVLGYTGTTGVYWALEDAAGTTTAADLSGNGHTLTTTHFTFGSSSIVPSDSNSCVLLSGSTGQCYGTNTSYNPSLTTCTMGSIITVPNLLGSNYPYTIIVKSGGTYIAEMYQTQGNINASWGGSFNNGSGIVYTGGGNSPPVLANNTYLLLLTWDNTTVKFYQYNLTTGTGSAYSPGSVTCSGGTVNPNNCTVGYNFANGAQIGRVFIAPIALTQTQCNQLATVAQTIPIIPINTNSHTEITQPYLGRGSYYYVRTPIVNSKLANALNINSSKVPKLVFKIKRLVQINVVRINKQKQWKSKAAQIKSIKQTKTKNSVICAVNILISRLLKSKSTNIKSTQIISSRISKIKKVTLKSVKILTSKITKQKQAKVRATQVVEAKVTKRVGKNSKATITYTIANSRRVTRYRQIKTVLVNAFSINKSINKNTRVSSTNIAYFTRVTAWEFLIQFVTKITSFKSQTIQRPNYGRPNPDPLDPNMVDTSTPAEDGLIANNPDDDSSIQ
jgi:hypothetical protein